jgi:hypothetical protein
MSGGPPAGSSRHPPQFVYDGSSYQPTSAEAAPADTTSSGVGDMSTLTNPYDFTENPPSTDYYQFQPMFGQVATMQAATEYPAQYSVSEDSYAGSSYLAPSTSAGLDSFQQGWDVAYQRAGSYYDPSGDGGSQFAAQVEQPQIPPNLQRPDFTAEEQVSASIRGKRMIFRDGPLAGKVMRWVPPEQEWFALRKADVFFFSLPSRQLQVRSRAGPTSDARSIVYRTPRSSTDSTASHSHNEMLAMPCKTTRRVELGG